MTTAKGQIGTEAEPDRAGQADAQSRMTPTIVAKDGKPVLVTGSPGGRTIINTVLCVVVNVIDFDMPIQDAVDAPRLHHQWFPDEAKFEGVKQYPDLVSALKADGARGRRRPARATRTRSGSTRRRAIARRGAGRTSADWTGKGESGGAGASEQFTESLPQAPAAAPVRPPSPPAAMSSMPRPSDLNTVMSCGDSRPG